MIRYYLHLDPDSLTDEEYYKQFRVLQYIRKEEAKNNPFKNLK